MYSVYQDETKQLFQTENNPWAVRNVICACSLGLDICVFNFRMDFELRGRPPQPPTFSSNSTKITKNAQF